MLYIKNGIIKDSKYITVIVDGKIIGNPTSAMILADGWTEYTPSTESTVPETTHNNCKDTFNTLPQLFWTGDTPTSKDDGNFKGKITYMYGDVVMRCYGTLKVQGTSSAAYPKKNFTIKLYKDADCSSKFKYDFGWGKQNKYVIKANWIDISHARNVVSARIWSQLVQSRSTYLSYPEELRTSPNQGVIDGFLVKFYVNGEYQGRYDFNIPKDAWMANMDSDNESQVILCGENYVSACFRATPIIDGTDWTDELHDTVPDTIKTRLTEAIAFCMDSDDETFKASLSDYFDVPSLIDYYVFGIMACHLDGFGKNQMFQCYDGQHFIAQVYDLDSTWGLYWDGSQILSYTYPRSSYEDFQSSRSGNLLYIRLASLFKEEIYARWTELKETVLSRENLIKMFEDWTNYNSNDLIAEDYSTSTADGAFVKIPSTSTNNIQQLRKFVVQRWSQTEEWLNTAEYFTLSVSNATPGVGASVTVSYKTNLESPTIVYTVTGNATFDESTMTLTVNSDASVSDVITITAVPNGDETLTSTVKLTVMNLVLLYSVNKTFTGSDTSEIVDTGYKIFTDEMTEWTIFIHSLIETAPTGTQETALHCMDETSPYPGLTVQSGTWSTLCDCQIITASSQLVNIVRSNNDVCAGIRRSGDTLYYTTDGTTWTTYEYTIPDVDLSLLVGGYRASDGTLGRPWKAKLCCYIYQGTKEDLSDLWSITPGSDS